MDQSSTPMSGMPSGGKSVTWLAILLGVIIAIVVLLFLFSGGRFYKGQVEEKVRETIEGAVDLSTRELITEEPAPLECDVLAREVEELAAEATLDPSREKVYALTEMRFLTSCPELAALNPRIIPTGDTGGDTGATAPVIAAGVSTCGNLVCETGEDATNCVADCQVAAARTCPEGTVLDDQTRTCILPIVIRRQEPPITPPRITCNEGQAYDEDTETCIVIEMAQSVTGGQACPEGTERNEELNECVRTIVVAPRMVCPVGTTYDEATSTCLGQAVRTGGGYTAGPGGGGPSNTGGGGPAAERVAAPQRPASPTTVPEEEPPAEPVQEEDPAELVDPDEDRDPIEELHGSTIQGDTGPAMLLPVLLFASSMGASMFIRRRKRG